MSHKSSRTTARPGVPNGTAQEDQPTPPGPQPRSIYERMTNPAPADMAAEVSARLRALSRPEIDRAVTFIGQQLEHLALQRNDMTVKCVKDDTSWTIRVEMP